MRVHPSIALVLALAAAPLLAQDPPPADVVEEVPPVLVTEGGIEAPTQPRGRSSSAFRRSPRADLRGQTGRFGRISSRVGSLVAVRGLEDNVVSGYGLVIGLAGTGDSGELATQMLRNLLLTHNINVNPAALASSNLAVVHVEATMPAGTKPGQKIDVRVSAIGDAESLYGGNLVQVELFGPAGETVYATASGSVTTGGFTVSGEAATATKNHNTVATLARGATVQREVQTNVVNEHGFIHLDAMQAHATLGNVVRIAEAIDRLFPGVSTVLPDGRTVRVAVPADLPESEYISYVDVLLQQEVETENLSRVVINERTGTIVMGGDVRLRPGVIAQGGLFVTIAETPQASQPGPLSGGETTTLPRTDLDVEEENNPLVVVPGAASLEEVVEVLNVLGASPRDLIQILTEMSEAGMLVAELRRM